MDATAPHAAAPTATDTSASDPPPTTASTAAVSADQAPSHRRGGTPRSRTLAEVGERLAARHLEAVGMTVVDRNWRIAAGDLRGELDLVCQDETTLVIVEVKARRGNDATPLEAVDPAKLARLRRLAGAWLAASERHADEVRIDVVAITWRLDGRPPEIDHLRGV